MKRLKIILSIILLKLLKILLSFWLGRAILWTAFCYVLVIAYYVYCAFFAENPQNYFNKEDMQTALIWTGIAGIFLGYGSPDEKKESNFETSVAEPKRKGSSKTAKVALGLGAAALAKSGPPSKQPNAYVVSGDLQVTGIQHRGGKKWRVHIRATHPSGTTSNDSHDITTGTGAIYTQGGQVKIDWS